MWTEKFVQYTEIRLSNNNNNNNEERKKEKGKIKTFLINSWMDFSIYF